MDRKQLLDMLYSKYGSLLLSRKQCAEVAGCSTAKLDRLKNAGLGPKYIKKKGKGKNGTVQYPIDAVIDYIVSQQVKTS
ncbi:MAG: hypothetical protein PHV10_04270 [Sulfuricurvum sp.]|nr:hypothetical protein [Sulfuricurvum sp.]